MRQILKSSCRMHFRVETKGPEAIFSRSSARVSWRGPSLRAFLLLAALQVIVLLGCVIDGLMTCCALGSILPQCCQQGLQFDRLLDLSIVRLRLSLSAHLEASLGPMFPSCRSASAHGCWRRVLRTPPPLLFLQRGMPQVYQKGGRRKSKRRGSM